MSADLAVSVLIPAKNEAENLGFLLDEIAGVLAGRAYEIIVVDDGSTDDTGAVLAARKQAGLPVRHIRHPQSRGQSAALRSGVRSARGDILVTVDGDGQNDPKFLPEMLDLLADPAANVVLVAAQRSNRTDGGAKKIASRFANGLRSRLLGDGARDTACGLKAIRREVFVQLPFFDGLHRFLPALVIREGFDVAFIDVIDRPRRFGSSHYGIMGRGVRGFFDLFGVWWLKQRFRGRADAKEIS